MVSKKEHNATCVKGELVVSIHRETRYLGGKDTKMGGRKR